jgi:hypothetical protein
MRFQAQHVRRPYTSQGVKILTVLSQLQIEKKITSSSTKNNKIITYIQVTEVAASNDNNVCTVL